MSFISELWVGTQDSWLTASRGLVGQIYPELNQVWEIWTANREVKQATARPPKKKLRSGEPAIEFPAVNSLLNLNLAFGTKLNICALELSENKQQFGVTELAPLFEFAKLKPQLQSEAFAFIGNADKLNHIAQNQLLKLLEEPPIYLHIILCAEREGSLLATVRSRCKVVHLLGGEKVRDEELRKLALEFFNPRSEGELYSALKQLEARLGSFKQNSDKQQFFSAFGEEIGQLVAEGLSQKTLSSADLAKLTNYQDLADRIAKFVRANVNTKLIASSIYSACDSYHY